jgi:hypothetical protein
LLVAFWVIQVGWVLALLSMAAGLGPLSRDPTLRLVLVYSLVLTAMVSAMVATTRFRVPFAFWISIAAGIGVDRALAGRTTRRALALVGLAVVLLGLSASRPMFQKIISGDFERQRDLRKSDWSFFRY